MGKLNKLERVLIIILLFLSVILGAGLGIFIAAFNNTTDIAELENFKPEIPSKIYDRNGNLISEIFTVKREPVTFEQIPKNLINALLAIEDAQFYSHHGINLKRVFGALVANIKSPCTSIRYTSVMEHTVLKQLPSFISTKELRISHSRNAHCLQDCRNRLTGFRR